MRAPFSEVILQMCYEDFFRSLQILGRLPLHSFPAIFVRIHCKTVILDQKLVKKLQLCG